MRWWVLPRWPQGWDQLSWLAVFTWYDWRTDEMMSPATLTTRMRPTVLFGCFYLVWVEDGWDDESCHADHKDETNCPVWLFLPGKSGGRMRWWVLPRWPQGWDQLSCLAVFTWYERRTDEMMSPATLITRMRPTVLIGCFYLVGVEDGWDDESCHTDHKDETPGSSPTCPTRQPKNMWHRSGLKSTLLSYIFNLFLRKFICLIHATRG